MCLPLSSDSSENQASTTNFTCFLGTMEITAQSLDADQENCLKAVNTKTDDRVSELSDDILSFILSFLTMRDAVKARVLSPRWRNLCPSIPNLQFDLFTIFGINYDENNMGLKKAIFLECKPRFVNAVNQFLELYRRPKIYSFKVCYGLGNDSASDIDRWINFAVSKQTEKLVLKLPLQGESYNFPCHLLPQGKISLLKHLCLASCILRPAHDFEDCFNSLNKLHLSNICLDQDAFDIIFFGCIDLKELFLVSCKLPVNFFICGQFQCLELLLLERCLEAKKIELSSISVTTFEYIDIGTDSILSFPGVSCKNMHLRYDDGSGKMFARLAKDLPWIEKLTISLYSEEIWPPLETKFSYLKELELNVFLSPDFDLLSVASILNVSPCLQKFHLALQLKTYHATQAKCEYSKQLYYQLKEVEISGFRDDCNSLELVKYLLNSAVQLKRIVINSRRRRYQAAGRWRYYKYLTMNRAEKQRVRSLLLQETVKSEVKLIVV